MPIYKYTCIECNTEKELILTSHKNMKKSISCTKCKGKMTRDMSGDNTIFQLKGRCWARDGYK